MFFLLIFSQLILVFVSYKYFSSTEAATVAIRPFADGPTLQWASFPTGSHYTAVDDAVISPTAADTSDYISVPGVGSGGTEKDELLFNIPRPFDAISEIRLWIYAKDDLCRGSGGSPCDTLSLNASIGALSASIGSISPSVGAFGWTKVSFNVSLLKTKDVLDQLNAQATTTVKLAITRAAKGSGGNNDAITIAAIYVELITEPNKGGESTESNTTVVTGTVGATKRHGGQLIDEYGLTNRPATIGASSKSGGESAE